MKCVVWTQWSQTRNGYQTEKRKISKHDEIDTFLSNTWVKQDVFKEIEKK